MQLLSLPKKKIASALLDANLQTGRVCKWLWLRHGYLKRNSHFEVDLTSKLAGNKKGLLWSKVLICALQRGAGRNPLDIAAEREVFSRTANCNDYILSAQSDEVFEKA